MQKPDLSALLEAFFHKLIRQRRVSSAHRRPLSGYVPPAVGVCSTTDEPSAFATGAQGSQLLLGERLFGSA